MDENELKKRMVQFCYGIYTFLPTLVSIYAIKQQDFFKENNENGYGDLALALATYSLKKPITDLVVYCSDSLRASAGSQGQLTETEKYHYPNKVVNIAVALLLERGLNKLGKPNLNMHNITVDKAIEEYQQERDI